MQGTGSWGSVTIDGCRYGFFAQYACSQERRLAEHTATPVSLRSASTDTAVWTNSFVAAILYASALLLAVVLGMKFNRSHKQPALSALLSQKATIRKTVATGLYVPSEPLKEQDGETKPTREIPCAV
jgi:hypothetical protein